MRLSAISRSEGTPWYSLVRVVVRVRPQDHPMFMRFGTTVQVVRGVKGIPALNPPRLSSVASRERRIFVIDPALLARSASLCINLHNFAQILTLPRSPSHDHVATVVILLLPSATNACEHLRTPRCFSPPLTSSPSSAIIPSFHDFNIPIPINLTDSEQI